MRPRQRKEGTFGCSLSLSLSLSLSFVLSPSRSRSLSLSLSLFILRSAWLLSLNIIFITANDDEFGETGDSNGRVKTLTRRPLSRAVGREKWFAPWRVPVVHIRARRPTGMFTTDTDEDFQLVRLRSYIVEGMISMIRQSRRRDALILLCLLCRPSLSSFFVVRRVRFSLSLSSSLSLSLTRVVFLSRNAFLTQTVR